MTGLDLEVHDGEFMVLVGPSGWGKTTALRMVAGLEEISEGTLKIGERVVNHVPSRDRDTGMTTAILNATDNRTRSVSTAKISPIAVTSAGTTPAQMALFWIAVTSVSLVNIAL